MLVFWNEVCDNMLRVKDEKTATALYTVQFKVLGKKQEDIKKRAEEKLKEMKTSVEAKELDAALIDSYDEILAIQKRLKECTERLEQVKKNAEGDTTHIKAIQIWYKDKMEFGINPGQFKAHPKWDMKGLVPKRPVLSGGDG